MGEAIIRIRRILDHGRWPTGLEVTARERKHLRDTLERLERERAAHLLRTRE